MKFIALESVSSATLFVVGLLFIGCSSQAVAPVRVAETGNIRVTETDSTTVGHDRLVLMKREHDLDSNKRPGWKGYDFHSIAWQRNENGEWINHLTIDERDFERDGRFPWVVSIHSFDPTTGTAVLRIGETGSPDDSGTVTATYSWREWDLNNNKEVRVIHLDAETTVYACPMCEDQQFKTHGTCPICEMQLQPALGSLPPNDN